MATFRKKADPSAEKLRGGYYTPPALAKFLVSWAFDGRESDRKLEVLEPSCGDGAILRAMKDVSGTVTAVELDAEEAQKASELNIGSVHNSDFFEWATRDSFGKFDVVIGNPPYIRFGNWRESERVRALAFIAEEGLRPSKLTNAWVPFVISSIRMAKPGGRVALVLPAELLQVSYARETRKFLVEHCRHITVVAFKKLVFDGILQEVVLLLAVVGEGPALLGSVEVSDSTFLSNLQIQQPHIPASTNHSEKWTTFFVGPSNVELIRLM